MSRQALLGAVCGILLCACGGDKKPEPAAAPPAVPVAVEAPKPVAPVVPGVAPSSIDEAGFSLRLAEAGSPQTRSLRTASAAIAIAVPDQKDRAVSRAYDEGRAAERILIAASFLGLGGGIAWIRSDARDAPREILGLPPDWLVRTIVALGHPSESARRPKSKPGEGRRPRQETVFEERWPKS